MLATGLLPVCIAILVVIAAGWKFQREQIEVTMRYGFRQHPSSSPCMAVMIYRIRGRFSATMAGNISLLPVKPFFNVF